MLSGREMLGLIERTLDETRVELEKIDTRSERSLAELARLRQAELGVLAVLARVRLREIESGELLEALDETGRRVNEILVQRSEAQAELNTQIAAEEEKLASLERERAAQRDAVDAAERAVDEAEAEAQRRLGEDAAYNEMLEKAKASDDIADLAESKAQAAHTDRLEKGKPYEEDALFAYLWTRGYGTSRYRAGMFTRWLDRWVARISHFEPLRRNYWMLSELPARFGEHAARMRKLSDEDLQALRAIELAAAEAAGVPEREQALEAEEAAQAELDRKLDEQEATIDALTEKRASFAAGEDDFSRRGMEMLSEALRTEQMRALRERANRTATREDDAAVDELTIIRSERPRLEDEVASYRSLHETHRGRLSKLEEIRKRFKEHHYDAVNSEFVNEALIATLLTQLLSGALGVGDVWGSLAKQQRYRRLHSDPHFGSGRFPRGIGGHKPPWRMPGGGGFGRGGGFGGGGFRTGGGFGKGGGFRTGGGF